MLNPRLAVIATAVAIGAALVAACVPTAEPPTSQLIEPPPTAAQATTTATTSGGSNAMCGWSNAAVPAHWDHVVLVVFENKSFAQLFDPAKGAPYFQSLASSCGLATTYSSVWTRSLANYLALTSGDTHGQLINPPPDEVPLTGPSIFQQLGSDWTLLADSAVENCQMRGGGSYYEPRHVPPLYYTDIKSTCATRVVPLGPTPDLSRRFTMIIPDKLHDMHMTDITPDTPSRIKAGNDWFQDFLPKILATPEYRAGRTAVIVTFDEGTLLDSRIPLFVISPYIDPGARETRSFNHYSLLRTMQEMMGLSPYLGQAAMAASMRGGALEL